MSTSKHGSIGEHLREEREAQSWSQKTLADKIETTVQNINRWEHNKSLPQPHYREKLCKVFNKSPEELFGLLKSKENLLIWNVPHLRNLYFTGREDILSYLHSTFSAKKTIALTQPYAINGLGGIGKTQVAIEYTYRYGEEYEAVIWIRADSQELLISDFLSVAELLNLSEKSESDRSVIVAACYAWLQHNSDWLLVFDNADNIEIASKFLPTRGKGNIILTTRSQATGKNIKAIEVDKMLPEEGILFLLRRAKVLNEDVPIDAVSSSDKKDAKTIYDLLDGLPLALDQAAAYIEENQSSLQDYLTLYYTYHATLLKRRGNISRLDYPRSVATTWSLSFKQVEQNNPAAAELLRLCAFLHPDAIPEEMIEVGSFNLGSTLQYIASDLIQLADAIGELRKYSLIRRNPNTKTLIIHRLVQVVIKDAMNKDLERIWAQRVVQLVALVFPEVTYETWYLCQRYLPHAQVCATLIKQWAINSSEATQLLDRVGFYLQERAQYDLTEPLYKQALDIREKVLGAEHPDIAHSLNHLAELYRIQGKYDQAEPLYQKALSICEQTLGPSHLDVAIILTYLAGLCRAQGKYLQAEPLFQRALNIREQALEPEHPDIAHSLNHLGLLYDTQGKYDQAEPLYIRALAIREKVLGVEHPDIAQSLNNLALLYYNQGSYNQAEPFYMRAIVMWERILGPDHPELAAGLCNMGLLYYTQGKYDQAEPLLMRALKIWKQKLGSKHPDVATAFNHLGGLYYARGNYKKAEVFCMRAIAIREHGLGPDHSRVAQSLNILAELYRSQGKYDQAEPLYIRALTIREKSLGPNHPHTAQSLGNLAKLYFVQEKYVQAEPLFARALTIYQQSLGSNHPDVAIMCENYVILLHKMNRETEAEKVNCNSSKLKNN